MENTHDKILIESAVQFLHEAEGMDDTAYETPASYKPVGILPVEVDDALMADIRDHGHNARFPMSHVIRNIAGKLGALRDYYGTTEITLDDPVEDVTLDDDNDDILTDENGQVLGIDKYPETAKFLDSLETEPVQSLIMTIRSIWISGREVAIRGQIFGGGNSPSDLRVPIDLMDTDRFPELYDTLKSTLMNRKRVSSSGHFGAAGDWMH